MKTQKMYFQAVKYFGLKANVFYLFRSNLCRNKSVYDAIGMFLFVYHNFMKTKYFVSKWIHTYNFVPVRIFKRTLTIDNYKFSHTHTILYPTQ